MSSGSGSVVQLVDAAGRSIEATEHGEIKTSTLSVIFYDQVEGTSINTNTWASSQDTMTQAQANGLVTLNSGSITTANKYSILQSLKVIPFYGEQVVEALFSMKMPVSPDANAVIEWGFGTVSGNSAPTDGAYFRYTNGALVGVTNFGGSETVSGPFPTVNPAVIHNCEIKVDSTGVDFHIDELDFSQQVECPMGLPFPMSNARQPLFLRIYNKGTPPAAAAQVQLGRVEVTQALVTVNKPWPETLCEIGRASHQSPIAPFAATSNRGNSSAPATAVLSNTVPSYATPDGQFKIAAVAAAETDYALFGFQVPAGFQFKVTSIAIDTLLEGAAVATPTTLEWAIGINSTAASLATVDGPGTVAPRRKSIGMQAFLALAGIGSLAQDLVRNFDPPLVIDSGRFFHIILRFPDGAATLNLVYRGTVMVNGFFE